MGGKKERRLFQSCFDLMTTLIQLFLQTINRTEECRSEIFALNGETSLNKKLASSLHRRQMNAFFFSTFPNKNKTVFLCAVQMVPSCSLTILFLLFFFQLKEKPRRKRLGWHFIWMNIWIQNLPGGVARFFFFFLNRKTDDVKREQVAMKTNCLPQKLSYSFSLIFFFFLF